MRWLLICVSLTAILAWAGWYNKPVGSTLPEPRMDRRRPLSIGPIRIGMTTEDVHNVLGMPSDRYQFGEIYSERKAPQGPWRVELKDGLVAGLDNGSLTQKECVLLSVGDNRAKMLRVLGAPAEEQNRDETTDCIYLVGDVSLVVTLGGYFNSPDHVNWISLTASAANSPGKRGRQQR